MEVKVQQLINMGMKIMRIADEINEYGMSQFYYGLRNSEFMTLHSLIKIRIFTIPLFL